MSAIDELRRMLDERGVAHSDHYLSTTWRGGHGIRHLAGEPMADGLLVVDMLTPEQAIAATLGSERERALEELVRDAYWLIARAVWTHVGQDKFAADWAERMSVLGIEVD